MTLDDLQTAVRSFEDGVSKRQGAYERTVANLQSVTQDLSATRQRLTLEEQVQNVLTGASNLGWTQVESKLESIVNKALAAVFTDRQYKFKMVAGQERGVPTLDFVVEEDGVEIDVWEEGGLGVADIIGLALRLLYIVLYRPKVRPVLYIDEPCKNLSEDYFPNMGRFLRQTAKEFGLQVVVVTHNTALMAEADKVYRLRKVDGKCVAE